MGVDRNTSIGPYMIVRGEVMEKVKDTVHTCSNVKCENYQENKNLKKEKFCSKCGYLVAEKEYSYEHKIDAHSLYNEITYNSEEFDEDALCWTDPMGCGGGVFIANYHSPYDKKMMQRKDELLSKYDEVVDLSDVDPQSEINWFNKEYKGIIDTFKEKFGEESVKVGWGVVDWYS